jgi:hypothetical protein
MQEQAYRLGSDPRFFSTEARRTPGGFESDFSVALCRSGEFIVAQSVSTNSMNPVE